MKDFLSISKERYTTKHYDSAKKIPENDVKDLLEVLRLAPSAVNIQPWHFFVGSTQKAKDLILPAIPDFNIPRIADCSHFVVLCSNTMLTDAQMSKITEVEVKDGRYPDHPEIKDTVDSHRKAFAHMHEQLGDFKEWTAKQAYIAMTALLYAAASKGIDSTPIEGMDFEKANEILNLKDKNLQSVMIVTLGYRKDDTNSLRPKSRLSYNDVIESLD